MSFVAQFNKNSPKTAVVGMSGGVDSSVTALILKEQGYKVIGIFMKNWEEDDSDDGTCTAAQDFDDVKKVCEKIDIPYYGVNFSKEYWDNVFQKFLSDYALGLTPNPDVLCNREIKFNVLLKKALDLGGDFLATGHYARIGNTSSGNKTLLKGSDPNKDQSYFLYLLNHKILDKVLYPIGAIDKSEVRKIAAKYNLATSQKKDSTGICFIGERKFTRFLSTYLPSKPGLFKTLDGSTVGEHTGAAYYTIGQRKGLGLGGQGERWFVLEKNIKENIVYVERGESKALFSNSLTAIEPSWVDFKGPAQFPYQCSAKIRYRQTDQNCIIENSDAGKLMVRFLEPQRAITPGQAIVFYVGEECIGGATILSYEKNPILQKLLS